MPTYPSTPNADGFVRKPESPAVTTAEDAAIVDLTYGAEEGGVVRNTRTRLAEVEQALRDAGLLA